MAKLPLDKMAAQLEDIAKDITGEYERKKVYPWDRIADATATIAEAVGADAPEKKYSTKKAQVADVINAIADADIGGGGSDGDFVALVERTISAVNNSEITYIGMGAFQSCSNLTTVNLPACTSATTGYMFAQCPKLTTIKLPALINIPNNAFGGISSSLSDITFTACETIGSTAFQSCKQLHNINFPSCKTIGSNAFASCTGLVSNISFPACETIYDGAFQNCFYITTLSFPACTQIIGHAFRNCSMLTSAYFLGSSVPSMGSTYAFYSTPIYGYTTFTSGEYGSIFVKQSMLSAFMSATNWSFFSERMVGLTDEEIAALENE